VQRRSGSFRGERVLSVGIFTLELNLAATPVLRRPCASWRT
jgi:hypothetical protein